MKPSPRSVVREPIAIVGMACRFPGAPSVDAYWRLLQSGTSAVREIPVSRWDNARYFSEDFASRGTIITRWGGFLDDVERFDWRAFRLSPREAKFMDPQQRLILELGWEALEDAGLPFDSLQGASAGVYIGVMWNDYYRLQAQRLSLLDGYSITGNHFAFISNRLSHWLGLTGPSLSLDVGCASSLMSVHLACQSIWSGETDLGLAGGVNLILAPDNLVSSSRAGFLSPRGRTCTFDASADGTVFSDGAGLLVLKPLAQALADGDPVHAVIKGSVANHNGTNDWIMAPKVDAQTQMLRKACERAGISPGDLDYVELHGTGTRKGDPIEAEAVGTVVGGARPADAPCAVGSVKTNIGHTEAAAGVAGLIKVALSLRHGQLPPSLNFEQPNPEIDLPRLNLKLQQELGPWPRVPGRPRRAAVNSLSFGGANAQVIMEEEPWQEPPPPAPERTRLFPLSASTPAALREQAERLGALLSSDAPPTLEDLAHTLSLRRTHLAHRETFVARTRTELLGRLAAAARGREAKAEGAQPEAKVAFVFSGQGSQWAGMGRELTRDEPVFREVLERCDAALRPEVGWSLMDALAAPEEQSRLADTEVAQPAIFAVQLALAELLRAWGIHPDLLVGHSVGEIAAAHLAGVLSFDEAIRIAARRGALMQKATGLGRMAQVELTPEEAEPLIAPWGGRLEIAAHNAPGVVVLSGETAALEEAVPTLLARGLTAQLLPVNYAFHSHTLDPLVGELDRVLGALAPRPARIPLVSSLTGRLAAPGDFGEGYWGRQMRGRVRFSEAIATVGAEGARCLLEVGAHPVLARPLAACAPNAAVAHCLRRRTPERDELLQGMGRLFQAGRAPDWTAINGPGRHTALPSYAWQKERAWLEGLGQPDPAAATAPAAAPLARPEWLHAVSWVDAPATVEGTLEGSVWVLAEDPTRAALVAEACRARGARAAEGQLFAGGESWAERLKALAEPPAQVVLWFGEEGATSADGGGARAFAAALGLAKAVSGWASPPRLHLATTGAQPALRPVQHPGQALLWGFGRTLSAEVPSAFGGLLDLDPAVPPARQAAQLVDALSRAAPEGNTVAFAGERRLEPRLRALPAPSGGAPFHIRAEATYLLTGGLGALGQQVARWLVEKGARRLLITGRSSLPPREAWDGEIASQATAEKVAAIRALEAKGAQVEYAAVDCADGAAVTRWLAERQRAGAALPSGVFHIAGVSRVQGLEEIAPSDVDAVVGPKLHGTWALFEALGAAKLDCFVLFSSASALLSSPRMGHYAAGNAFLDAFAHWARARGLPAVSVNWGPWAEGGMAADVDGNGALRLQGMELIPPEVGLSHLEVVLAAGLPQAAVLPIDWGHWLRAHAASARSPLFRELSAAPAPAASAAPAAPAPVERDLTEPAGLLAFLVQTMAENLAVPFEQIDPTQSLLDQGFDSLMMVEFKSQLERETGKTLPLGALLRARSLNDLATQLLALP